MNKIAYLTKKHIALLIIERKLPFQGNSLLNNNENWRFATLPPVGCHFICNFRIFLSIKCRFKERLYMCSMKEPVQDMPQNKNRLYKECSGQIRQDVDKFGWQIRLTGRGGERGEDNVSTFVCGHAISLQNQIKCIIK